MTTRSTNYSSAAPGKLEIIFAGGWWGSVSGSSGFPYDGGWDIRLECLVNNGSGVVAKAYINRSSPSSHVVLDYPGGGAVWSVSMSDVSSTFGGGLGSMSVTPQVSFLLVKR